MAKKRDLTSSAASTAPLEVKELVEKFAEHRATYRRPGYNETQLRQLFLCRGFIIVEWNLSTTYANCVVELQREPRPILSENR